MAATRRPRVARHTLGLGSLFPPETVFQDTDGDGYPDRLGLCLAVDPRLADAGMWAGLINLAARLAGEVLALDRAIAFPLAKAPDDRPCLVITASDCSAEAPVFRECAPGRWVACHNRLFAISISIICVGTNARYARTSP